MLRCAAMRRYAHAQPSSHPPQHSLIGNPSGQMTDGRPGCGDAGNETHSSRVEGREGTKGAISQLSNRILVNGARHTSTRKAAYHPVSTSIDGDAEPSRHAMPCWLMRVMAALHCSGNLFPWCFCPISGLAWLLLSCGVRVRCTLARHHLDSSEGIDE